MKPIVGSIRKVADNITNAVFTNFGSFLLPIMGL